MIADVMTVGMIALGVLIGIGWIAAKSGLARKVSLLSRLNAATWPFDERLRSGRRRATCSSPMPFIRSANIRSCSLRTRTK